MLFFRKSYKHKNTVISKDIEILALFFCDIHNKYMSKSIYSKNWNFLSRKQAEFELILK